MPPSHPGLRPPLAGLAFGLACAGWSLPAYAGNYEFLAAPQKDLNRVYRLDRLTGEVGACQFALNPGKNDIAPGAFGITLCYPPGEGAGKQESSEYGLVASRHEQEGGVFRVDFRTGMMSICYVYNDAVVCTPQAK
ncbi:MAG: hypothetical protein JO273_26210 [Methylobacteriaceae bacterium]|nr:hypothetical protein [Methylobacteriaceae bacterium]